MESVSSFSFLQTHVGKQKYFTMSDFKRLQAFTQNSRKGRYKKTADSYFTHSYLVIHNLLLRDKKKVTKKLHFYMPPYLRVSDLYLNGDNRAE